MNSLVREHKRSSKRLSDDAGALVQKKGKYLQSLNSMSSSSNGSPNPSLASLQILSFRTGRVPGNNLLHEFVLDHSDPYHSSSKYSQAYIDCILQSMFDAPVNGLNHEEYSPLHLAVLKNNVLMVKHLLFCLKNRINVNIKGEFHRTPLHLAAEAGHDKVVKELLTVPVILVNEKDKYDDQTPLHLAAKAGHDKVVKELLTVPVILVNEKNKYDQTPLHLAAKAGHDKVVKELLTDPRILVNEKDIDYHAPLYIAAKRGYDKVVKELLTDPRILVNEKDIDICTPLNWVERRGYCKIAKKTTESPNDSR